MQRFLPLAMLVGLAAGVAAGAALTASGQAWVVTQVLDPVGQVWMRAVLLLVVPLAVCALILGVQAIGQVGALGRLGLRCLLWSTGLACVAVAVGVLLVATIQPGAGIAPEQLGKAVASTTLPPAAKAGSGWWLSLMPNNLVAALADNGAMLGILVASLLIGLGILATRTPAVARLVESIQGLFEVLQTLLRWVMAVAPLGVACLSAVLVTRVGLEIIAVIGAFAGVVVAGLLLHALVVYGLCVRLVGGRSPWRLWLDARQALLTAFSTASSVATLPTTLDVAEHRCGLPGPVARFVLTIGASANQHGTALFDGVAVLFMAQAYGVELGIAQQAMICGICVLAGIGTAGVPGGAIPVIMMMLGMVGVPAEGVALILGIDRVLDMCRTTVNVAGDLALTAIVAGPPSARTA